MYIYIYIYTYKYIYYCVDYSVFILSSSTRTTKHLVEAVNTPSRRSLLSLSWNICHRIPKVTALSKVTTTRKYPQIYDTSKIFRK